MKEGEVSEMNKGVREKDEKVKQGRVKRKQMEKEMSDLKF